MYVHDSPVTLLHQSGTISTTLVRRLMISLVAFAFSTSSFALLSFFLVQGPQLLRYVQDFLAPRRLHEIPINVSNTKRESCVEAYLSVFK